ncbi:hypothetical protein I2I05_11635 [Hymenobacter sp. BT683]|uniref:Uncharacterized protein n=1 Tax=Hymenobacter jeongseonensis TaxID=2791027 RepID=A0ABS0II73_9BACT|nr:hypothetical protein [Hymenobacter jeongseonensis]MBF9238046.1 hypothetical protein [Hymenobacter jeongseonensis]
MGAFPYAPALQLAVGVEDSLVLWEPTTQGNQAPSQVYPLQGDVPNELKFVRAKHLVTLGDYGAVLHFVGDDEYNRARIIETEHTPVVVLETVNSQRFALMEGNGCLTLHAV